MRPRQIHIMSQNNDRIVFHREHEMMVFFQNEKGRDQQKYYHFFSLRQFFLKLFHCLHGCKHEREFW